MIIYILLFTSLIINMFIFRKNKKAFIIVSFFELFLIAALRKYTVGIDLEGHYANNFIAFGETTWERIINLIKSQNSFYDFGLILFMKIISMISKNEQFFIVVTSALIYGLVGRYIYKHSKNVYIETVLFFTTYTYFMFMNIIAQALAVAIVLFSVDYLEKKSYIKFGILVLLANCIHSSAIICLIFIPLNNIKLKNSNIEKMTIAILIMLMFFDRILPLVIKNIYPQFAFYFANQGGARIDRMQLLYMGLYTMFWIVSVIIRFYATKERKAENKTKDLSSLWFYATMLAIMFRYLGINKYIFSRMGFYFYLFSHSLMAQSIEQVKNKKIRIFVKCSTYIFMFIFFISLTKSLKSSYGVLPYKFYWE